MRRPEPCRQRQLGAVHRRPRRDRRLTAAARAFVSVSPALQRRRATLAAHGADEAIRPAPPEQKRRAGRLVGKLRLELPKRPRPGHRLSRHSRLTASQSEPHTTYSATWDNAISHARQAMIKLLGHALVTIYLFYHGSILSVYRDIVDDNLTRTSSLNESIYYTGNLVDRVSYT